MSPADLEFEVKSLQRAVEKVERDLREQYGLIKELSGKISVTAAIDGLREDVARVQSVNLIQSEKIGAIAGGLSAIKDAMSHSSDAGLRQAASNITINVEGGKSHSGDITNHAGMGGNINQGAVTVNQKGV